MRWLAFVSGLAALGALSADAHAQGDRLSLGEAIRMACGGAPSLRVAAAEIERADAEHSKAVAGYLPRLSAGMTGTGQSVRDTLPPIRQPFTLEPYSIRAGSGEGRADLRWTLLDFGKTSGAVGAARRLRDAREHSAHATKGEITRVTATLFLTVVYDAEVLASKRTSVHQRARHAALAKALVEKGVRAPIDEVRARLNLEAARQDLVAAEGRLLIDQARLASTLGVEVDALGVPSKPSLPALDEPASRAATYAERVRPEVAVASLTRLAREEALDAARAQYLPTIGVSVGGSYRLTRYIDAGRDLVPRAEVTGQLTVTVPIFDAHTSAAVAEARADVAVSEAQETDVRRRTRTEAAVAALELRNARALDVRARGLVASTQAALDVIEARYRSGLSSPLDLVDAEASSLEAREALLGAEYRQQVATVDLAVATGRAALLWGK